jgi:hypothetical protein
MPNRNLTRFAALASTVALTTCGSAVATTDDAAKAAVVGTWLCSAIRAGSTLRPILFMFRGDGTMDYFSGTTINTTTNSASPVYESGFNSRGGGHGMWTVMNAGTSVYSFHAVEILHNDLGNGQGLFNVEQVLQLTADDQLCTGRADKCSVASTISLARFKFATDADSVIVGQDTLLPANTPANLLCNRLAVGAFPSGSDPNSIPAIPLLPTH